MSRVSLSRWCSRSVRTGGVCALLALSLLTGPSGADERRTLTGIPFQEVTSPAGTGSAAPNLTVGNGRAYLTWVEAADLKLSVWEDSTWSAPRVIVSDGNIASSWASMPAFLVLGDGTLAAAWVRQVSGGHEAGEVWVSTSKDGGKTWADPLKPHHDGTKTEHGFVSLMPDPEEGFWVVWLDGRNYAHQDADAKHSADTELRTSLWRGGSFDKEIVLDKRVCDCCQTAAVLTSEGLAVAYRDRTGDETRDISLIRFERSLWSQPSTLNADGWKIAGCPVTGPAMDSRDSLFALSWFTDANEVPKVYVVLSDSSASALSRIVQVDDGKPLGRTDVQWLPDRSVLVTWVEQIGDAAVIRARRVTLTGEMDAPLTLAPTTLARTSGFPRLAGQATNIWMAWTDTSTSPGKVRVGRLDLRQWE